MEMHVRLKSSRTAPWWGALVVLASGCWSPYYTDRGAAVGGVTGALAGAAIGDHNGHPVAGTLLGGAAGALTGAAIGNTMDREIAAAGAAIESRLGRRITGAATVDQVIEMSRAGLSEEIMTTHIRGHGVAQPPSVDDLIRLREAGVTDTVIQVMQQTGRPVTRASASGPIIVEEYHYGAPPPAYYPRRRMRLHGHFCY